MSVRGNKQDFDKDLLALLKKYDKIPTEDKTINDSFRRQKTIEDDIAKIIDSLSGLSLDGVTIILNPLVYHLEHRGAKVIVPQSDYSVRDALKRIEDVVMKQYEKMYGEWEG